MEMIYAFLSAVPGILLWSVVLSFIPNALYCILRDSRAYKERVAQLRGIYVIANEEDRRREDKAYMRGIFIIYGIIFLLFAAVAMINWVRHGKAEINPFDMLSSTSLVLFWISLLSYIPFMIYLAWKDPKQYMIERTRFTGIFALYGVGLFIFCLFYAGHWFAVRQIPLGFLSLMSSFATIILCSAALSYVPIMGYMFFQASAPNKNRKIRFNIIFVIYIVCFLIFSSIYVFNWIADRRLEEDLKKQRGLSIAAFYQWDRYS